MPRLCHDVSSLVDRRVWQRTNCWIYAIFNALIVWGGQVQYQAPFAGLRSLRDAPQVRVRELLLGKLTDDSLHLTRSFIRNSCMGAWCSNADCILALADVNWHDCLLKPIRKPCLIPAIRYSTKRLSGICWSSSAQAAGLRGVMMLHILNGSGGGSDMWGCRNWWPVGLVCICSGREGVVGSRREAGVYYWEKSGSAGSLHKEVIVVGSLVCWKLELSIEW